MPLFAEMQLFEQPPGGAEGGDGGNGGDGGDGGGDGGGGEGGGGGVAGGDGGGDTGTPPQSVQSVPMGQEAYCDPGPPSSQKPSAEYSHESVHVSCNWRALNTSEVCFSECRI